MKWTEAAVTDALRGTYLPATSAMSTEEWAFLTQVLLRCPGLGHHEAIAAGHRPSVWQTNERKIDVLLVRNWSGGKHGHERLAIEIKVAKADYDSETPQKRAPAEASAHRCAYAAPAGLIDPATLPDGWGLIEVHADHDPASDIPVYRTTWRKPAKRRTPTADLDYLISAGFRRASRAEERIRRADTDATELASLRQQIATLQGIAHRAVEARDREIARAKAARNELLAFAGAQECATCGEALTWKRGGHHDGQWQHKNRAADDVCKRIRWHEYERAVREGEPVDYPNYPIPLAAAAA